MREILLNIRVMGSLFIVLIVLSSLFWLVNSNQEKAKKIEDLRKENIELKNNMGKLTTEYDHLSKEYDSLNKEKNGSANESLLDVTNNLFSCVYNYDTDEKADSISARKGKAMQYANDATLDKLFSKNADKLTTTVTTISKMDGEPEVYRMSSDDEKLTALVLVKYSLSIADSNKQEGNFMYKIVFDPKLKKVIDLNNIGEISIL
ncbi:TPA: hypothetical protein ACF1RY_002815 [Enterococcus hirae]